MNILKNQRNLHLLLCSVNFTTVMRHVKCLQMQVSDTEQVRHSFRSDLQETSNGVFRLLCLKVKKGLQYGYGLNHSGLLSHLQRHILNSQAETGKTGKNSGVPKIHRYTSSSDRIIFIFTESQKWVWLSLHREKTDLNQIRMMVSFSFRFLWQTTTFSSWTKKQAAAVQ